jgi:hypothetical protein
VKGRINYADGEVCDLRSSKGTQRWANMSPATAASTASERTTTPSKTVYNTDSSNVYLLSHIRTPASPCYYATKPWWQAPLVLTRVPYGVEESLRLEAREQVTFIHRAAEKEAVLGN